MTNQLDVFIEKFTPEIAAIARRILDKMRSRLPGAIELVYDTYNALAIAFGPTERASDAIFSIALYPRWVSLFFLQGAGLPDPTRRLKGSGSVARHIVLKTPEMLKAPEIRDLMDNALSTAKVPLDPSQPHGLVIKSVSEKQRSRRPLKTHK